MAKLSSLESLHGEKTLKNFTEPGAAHLRSLAGYVGLDFSVEALVKSGLKEYVYADVTRHIPYPGKVFDSVLCMSVLMHIPPDKVGCAVSEISRVARSLVMLWEPRYQQGKTFQPHTFNHDLVSLFAQHFQGEVVFIGNGDFRV